MWLADGAGAVGVRFDRICGFLLVGSTEPGGCLRVCRRFCFTRSSTRARAGAGNTDKATEGDSWRRSAAQAR